MERGNRSLIIQRLVTFLEIAPEEVVPVLWSGLWFFSILASYYIIRPLRDEMGVAGGVENLPWLFTGTLVAVLLAHPAFSFLVGKFPRARFVAYTYHFFGINLLIFYLLLTSGSEPVRAWTAKAFWIWSSVFNLFVMSIFWAFVVDAFSEAPARRLFGLIALGGTLGGVTGSLATAVLARFMTPAALLILAAALLEAALLCMSRLSRHTGPRSSVFRASIPESPAVDAVASDASTKPVGGSPWAGITKVLQSRYLAGISLFMILFTVTATYLYFQQAELFVTQFSDRSERTAMFATVDLLVNTLTIFTQALLTGRIIRTLGVGATLALLPAVSALGFSLLGAFPVIPVLVFFQVLRRAGNFALTHPAREVLYTLVEREDKYKAKNLIDTFVYRAGDQLGAWTYRLMGTLGLSVSGVSWVAVPLSLLWMYNAIWLGRQHHRLQQSRT